jgi:hypothetical protein
MLWLIFPFGLSRPGIAAETSSASASSFAIASVSACANKTSRESGAGPLAVSAGLPAVPEGCADPIDKCKKPNLGSKGDCACFACEYATATQHNICTQNKKDKETLLAESGPE